MNNNMMTPKQFNEESKRKEQKNLEDARKKFEEKEERISQIENDKVSYSTSWGITFGLITVMYLLECIIGENGGFFEIVTDIVIGGSIIATLFSPIIHGIRVVRKNSSKKAILAEINKPDESLEETKKNIIKAAEDERKKYSDLYEREVQRRSVNFAESVLAKEVIEWMTKGFCKTIEAADRRSHIQKINVPFNFHVYSNKITCNLGTYDFELHRCANLTELMDQAALARAIVTEIQLNIRMKYSKDMSGTDFNLSIEYEYGDDSFSTSISYEAPNGYYKEVRKWDY